MWASPRFCQSCFPGGENLWWHSKKRKRKKKPRVPAHWVLPSVDSCLLSTNTTQLEGEAGRVRTTTTTTTKKNLSDFLIVCAQTNQICPFWTPAYLFDEMLDGPLASADTPHVIETHHLPLHAEQHGSSVQSHSGGKQRHASREGCERSWTAEVLLAWKFFLWLVWPQNWKW